MRNVTSLAVAVMLGGLTATTRVALAETCAVPTVPTVLTVTTTTSTAVATVPATDVIDLGVSVVGGWRNSPCLDGQCEGIHQWVTPHAGAGPETAPVLAISTGTASTSYRLRTGTQTDAAATLRIAGRVAPRRGFGVRLVATGERLGWRTRTGTPPTAPMTAPTTDRFGGAIGVGLTQALREQRTPGLNLGVAVDAEYATGLVVRGGLGLRRTTSAPQADGGVGLVAGWDLDVLSLRAHARYLRPLAGDDDAGSAIDLGLGISSRFDWSKMDPGRQWPLEIWLDARQRAALAGGARDLTFAGGLNFLPSEGLYRVGVEVVTTRERLAGGAAVDGRALLLNVERPWGTY